MGHPKEKQESKAWHHIHCLEVLSLQIKDISNDKLLVA
jgi:hypothetical protein